jgi:NAD(P)-dependent dehydrogenase (short-subunit alcohol dehydrogenase family)
MKDHYAGASAIGATFGPAFQCLQKIRLGDEIAVGEVSLPPGVVAETGLLLHPGLLDAALQLTGTLLAHLRPEAAARVLVPISLGEMFLSGTPTTALHVVARITESDPQLRFARADVRLETPAGIVVALLNDVMMSPLPSIGRDEMTPDGMALRTLVVHWQQAAPPEASALPSVRYVLLGDDATREFTRTLEAELRRAGSLCVLLEAEACAAPETAAVTNALQGEPGTVIDCRALVQVEGDLAAAVRTCYARGLAAIKSVAAAGAGVSLYLLTRAALAVESGDEIGLAGTVLPGLVRAAAAEYPDRLIALADLDRDHEQKPGHVVQLIRALSLTRPEAALRKGRVMAPTLKIVSRPDAMSHGQQGLPIRSDGTYLVSGGLGGIGLKIAEWLIGRGAGGVLLLGRQPPNENQLAAIASLRTVGGVIQAVQCDVSDPAALLALRGPLESLPPVRGVLHAAGALADAPVAAQDAAHFEAVARSKVDGAIRLHEFTRDHPLDLFVLFSSVSGTLGAPGQANYAAANTFLDGLAAWRRRQRLPALSVAWGAWSSEGMVTTLSAAHQARFKRIGMGLLQPAPALRALQSAPSGEPVVVIAQIDSQRLSAHARPGVAALLAGLLTGAADRVQQPQPADRGGAAAAAPMPLRDFLIGEIACVLGFDRSQLDMHTPLPDLGFDSMMAIQVRNIAASQLGLDVPLRLLLQGATVATLVDAIAPHAEDREIAVDAPTFEEGAL